MGEPPLPKNLKQKIKLLKLNMSVSGYLMKVMQDIADGI